MSITPCLIIVVFSDVIASLQVTSRLASLLHVYSDDLHNLTLISLTITYELKINVYCCCFCLCCVLSVTIVNIIDRAPLIPSD